MDAGDRLDRGPCGPTRCDWVGDFIDVQIAPDGTPWAAYADLCDEGCALWEDSVQTFSAQPLLVARLVGESLWDASDPNGPYPS